MRIKRKLYRCHMMTDGGSQFMTANHYEEGCTAQQHYPNSSFVRFEFENPIWAEMEVNPALFDPKRDRVVDPPHDCPCGASVFASCTCPPSQPRHTPQCCREFDTYFCAPGCPINNGRPLAEFSTVWMENNRRWKDTSVAAQAFVESVLGEPVCPDCAKLKGDYPRGVLCVKHGNALTQQKPTKIVRVTQTVDYLLEESDRETEELVREWFYDPRYPLDRCHAHRDGSRIGNSTEVLSHEIVTF